MRYLVDTSALIRYVRGNRAAVERVTGLAAAGETLGCCAIVVAEFYAGVAPGRRANWDRLLNSLEFWPATWLTAVRAGQYRREARLRNRALTTSDALIAAVAYEQSAILLTANPRDFQIPGLAMESVP